MCGGGAKRAARDAERRAAQQAAMYEEQLRAAEARNQQVIEALTPKNTPSYTPDPIDTGAGLKDNGGVQKKKSRKSSIIDANRGVASLRIPLNTGGVGGSSGPNIG
jgi:hypothetical protein